MNTLTTRSAVHAPCACCGQSINRNAAATTTICVWCKGIHSVGRQILKNKNATDRAAHDAYFNQK